MMDNVVKAINESAEKIEEQHEQLERPEPQRDQEIITMTRGQFYQLREGIAGAHLLTQRVLPFLKQRHAKLDKDTRHLANIAPEPIRIAFQLSAQISAEQEGTPPDFSTRVPEPLQDIDVKTMRNELENVSALELPDIAYQMACALEELPMLRQQCLKHTIQPPYAAALLAWAWEAGRRYGMIEALSVFDLVSAEFTEGTRGILERARDRSLDLTIAPDTSAAAPAIGSRDKSVRSHRGPQSRSPRARANQLRGSRPTNLSGTCTPPAELLCRCSAGVFYLWKGGQACAVPSIKVRCLNTHGAPAKGRMMDRLTCPPC